MTKLAQEINTDAVELAKKYFADAHLTGEGYLYFNKGFYVYVRNYGYAIIPFHKKVVAKCKDIKELEEYFQDVACGTTPAESKKVEPKPKKESVKNKLTPPTGKRWGSGKVTEKQIERAEKFLVSNIRDYSREQASYILRLADPELRGKVDEKHYFGYGMKKLDESGVKWTFEETPEEPPREFDLTKLSKPELIKLVKEQNKLINNRNN